MKRHPSAAHRCVSVAVHVTIRIPARTWADHLGHNAKDSVPALCECHRWAREADVERDPCSVITGLVWRLRTCCPDTEWREKPSPEQKVILKETEGIKQVDKGKHSPTAIVVIWPRKEAGGFKNWVTWWWGRWHGKEIYTTWWVRDPRICNQSHGQQGTYWSYRLTHSVWPRSSPSWEGCMGNTCFLSLSTRQLLLVTHIPHCAACWTAICYCLAPRTPELLNTRRGVNVSLPTSRFPDALPHRP